jgi:hypothetical protein
MAGIPPEKGALKSSLLRERLLGKGWQIQLGNFDKLGTQSIADGTFIRSFRFHRVPADGADVIIYFLVFS